MKEDNRTFDELHTESWQVQDACNLSGVVHSFSRAMTRLWKLADENKHGTAWVNSNEVTRLFASKILHLAGELHANDIPNKVVEDLNK